MIYIVEEHLNLLAKLGIVIGFDSSSSINGLGETPGCESLSLSRVRSIRDEAPRFCHVACEEESSCNHARPIKN